VFSGLRAHRRVAGRLVSEEDAHGWRVRCARRPATTGGGLDSVRFIELIEGETARLPPEGRDLWEELEFIKGSIPDPAD
jgi:hypothetical protein